MELRTPIRFTFGLAVTSLLFFTNRAGSDQLLTEQTSACRRVDACLLVLDGWSKSYNDRIEDVSAAVLNLKRFGEPMRHALLERAVGTDLRSRQLAELLLSAWGGWTKDDVPELAKVLASNHGGMIAHALGDDRCSRAAQACSRRVFWRHLLNWRCAGLDVERTDRNLDRCTTMRFPFRCSSSRSVCRWSSES